MNDDAEGECQIPDSAIVVGRGKDDVVVPISDFSIDNDLDRGGRTLGTGLVAGQQEYEFSFTVKMAEEEAEKFGEYFF